MVGDRVKINFELLKQHSDMRSYLKAVAYLVRKGGGTAEIMALRNDKAQVAASGVDAMLGVVDVPIAVLTKDDERKAITEKF